MGRMKDNKITEKHPRSDLLSNFILGSQDGLVNVLGILLGLSAATSSLRLILSLLSPRSGQNPYRWAP